MMSLSRMSCRAITKVWQDETPPHLARFKTPRHWEEAGLLFLNHEETRKRHIRLCGNSRAGFQVLEDLVLEAQQSLELALSSGSQVALGASTVPEVEVV